MTISLCPIWPLRRTIDRRNLIYFATKIHRAPTLFRMRLGGRREVMSRTMGPTRLSFLYRRLPCRRRWISRHREIAPPNRLIHIYTRRRRSQTRRVQSRFARRDLQIPPVTVRAMRYGPFDSRRKRARDGAQAPNNTNDNDPSPRGPRHSRPSRAHRKTYPYRANKR